MCEIVNGILASFMGFVFGFSRYSFLAFLWINVTLTSLDDDECVSYCKFTFVKMKASLEEKRGGGYLL